MNEVTLKKQLHELQIFLNQASIPEIKAQPKTFLGIAKQPHYENVLSNIYSFYFNVYEEHGFKDLFINSLIELIRKSNRFDNDKLDELEELHPGTEVATKEGGRIDLLLSNQDQAIIIENKVFHILNNVLENYWNSIEVDFKVGVVLSLKQLSEINNEFFINITHKELLDTVISNLGSYILEGNDKYIVFLKDLYQNIINLSSKTMKDEEIKLYLDNRQKIQEVVNLDQRIKDYVVNEVEKACVLLSAEKQFQLVGKRNTRFRYYALPNISNLVIVVVFEGLFKNNDGYMHLIVEPRHNEIEKTKKIDRSVFSENERKILKEPFNADGNNVWAHFAHKAYKLDSGNLSDLSNFIVQSLKKDHLLAIFDKLERFLTANK